MRIISLAILSILFCCTAANAADTLPGPVYTNTTSASASNGSVEYIAQPATPVAENSAPDARAVAPIAQPSAQTQPLTAGSTINPTTGQPSQQQNAIQPEQAKAEPVKPRKKYRKVPVVGKVVVSTDNTIPYKTISIGNDETRVISLSRIFPNRISTPFDSPRVIDSTNIDMKQDGSSIYVSPKETKPFTIYVTGSDPGDQVIALTIIPQEIPSQTVILQTDAASNVSRQQKTESYTQKIVNLLRTVAMGDNPEGYAVGNLPLMTAVNNTVSMMPKKRFSGSWLDVYTYQLVNNGKEKIMLSETSFYKKGVKAVSIFPNLEVLPGQTTMIYVVTDKTAILDGGFDGRK